MEELMMMTGAGALKGRVLSGFFTYGALWMLVLGYFFISWDKKREDSPSRDDHQVGLKLVLYTLLIVSVGIAAGGVDAILGFILSGAKQKPMIKGGIASLITGGGIFAVIHFMLLPRTNAADFNRVERYAAGYVAAVAGLITIVSLDGFLSGLISGAKWKQVSSFAFADTVVFGGLAFLAVNKFGQQSGWTAAVRPAPMAGYAAPQHMPQQMPPQGYPPQGAPPQGGYPPPQGGGYPPPQGGGYPPPQGGGGLPPPAGGGYPPQGGGGGGYQP